MLGCYFAFGWHPYPSEEQAAAHFKRAADQGHAEAQYNYSVCLLEGKGIETSVVEVIHYLELAAMQGNADAQYNLGICYLQGNGVPLSEHRAIEYFELAAKQKHPKALDALEAVLKPK
jgi:TPR repeat protein